MQTMSLVSRRTMTPGAHVITEGSRNPVPKPAVYILQQDKWVWVSSVQTVCTVIVSCEQAELRRGEPVP